MALKNTLFLALFALAGCAYGYAGQEGKRRNERKFEPSVKVVEVREDSDGAGDNPKTEQDTAPEAEPAPCGRPTFEIFFYSASTQVTKTIDCTKRTVVDVQRTPIGETTLVDSQAAGLPQGAWYLLVDPKGVRGNFLNNAQLLKLSQQFAIEYYGRDAGRDLLVYLYEQADVQ